MYQYIIYTHICLSYCSLSVASRHSISPVATVSHAIFRIGAPCSFTSHRSSVQIYQLS